MKTGNKIQAADCSDLLERFHRRANVYARESFRRHWESQGYNSGFLGESDRDRFRQIYLVRVLVLIGLQLVNARSGKFQFTLENACEAVAEINYCFRSRGFMGVEGQRSTVARLTLDGQRRF